MNKNVKKYELNSCKVLNHSDEGRSHADKTSALPFMCKTTANNEMTATLGETLKLNLYDWLLSHGMYCCIAEPEKLQVGMNISHRNPIHIYCM